MMVACLFQLASESLFLFSSFPYLIVKKLKNLALLQVISFWRIFAALRLIRIGCDNPMIRFWMLTSLSFLNHPFPLFCLIYFFDKHLLSFDLCSFRISFLFDLFSRAMVLKIFASFVQSLNQKDLMLFSFSAFELPHFYWDFKDSFWLRSSPFYCLLKRSNFYK